MFADNTDIQAWLESSKITVDDANSQKPNIEAERLIKGQLTGVFEPVVISSWADPASTPELIRSIAGRLAAAYMYYAIYSEESDAISPYAQWLYNGAIAMLTDVRTGALIVTDDSEEPIDVSGAELLSFWPSDNAPKFTMDQEFA